MSRRRAGIGARLALVVMLCIAAILSASLGFYHVQARARLLAHLEADAEHVSQMVKLRVERVLLSARRSAEALAQALGSSTPAPSEIESLLRRTLARHPELFSIAVTFEPEALARQGGPASIWLYREQDAVRLAEALNPEHYRFEDWYLIPRELGQGTWVEPYVVVETGTPQLLATFGTPIPWLDAPAAEDHRLIGILSVDIALDWLSEELSAVGILETGVAILLSRSGTVLAHPNADLIMNETLFSLAAMHGGASRREQARTILAGEAGFLEHSALFGGRARVHYTPIRESDWTLAIVFPEGELFAELNQLTLGAATIGLIGLLFAMLAVMLIARSISLPLRALAISTGRIATGDFAAPLPRVRRRDEVGALTDSFASMRAALRAHIDELQRATAAKERVDRELAIAREIQLGILPRPEAMNSQRAEVTLSALILPAREVGGDFYDLFLLDQRHLCLLIADVSDKGVPAALFMAVTKTLIKATARDLRDPAAILTRVNADIAADNERNLFVTVFCALLDLSNGMLTYANAGHNPPILIPADGSPSRLLRNKSQLLLGVMPAVSYRADGLLLQQGDRVLLYTDGITEAMDGNGGLYSEGRLLELQGRLRNRSLNETLESVLAAVRDFAAGTPQSDDMTLLALEFHGPARGPYTRSPQETMPGTGA